MHGETALKVASTSNKNKGDVPRMDREPIKVKIEMPGERLSIFVPKGRRWEGRGEIGIMLKVLKCRCVLN